MVGVEGRCAVSKANRCRLDGVHSATSVTKYSIPNIKPRKALGQYFLADNRILSRIVAAAAVGPGDLVLEVGPGRGALTRRLVDRGAQGVLPLN